MEHLAHIVFESDEKIRRQTLRAHCRTVGFYASECLKTPGLQACGMLAGLLHDGKGTDKFQSYLRQSAEWDAFDKGIIEQPSFERPVRGRVNHTFAGMIYLFDRYHGKKNQLDDLTSEVIACAISSHHGLFDCMSIEKKNGFVHRVKDTDRKEIQYQQAKDAFEQEVSAPEELDELFEKSKKEIRTFIQGIDECFRNTETWQAVFMQLSMAVRMLTSALMYADRRDTAEFQDKADYKDIQADWQRDISNFENKYRALSEAGVQNGSAEINTVRSDISRQCKEFAVQPGNIYRLNVPTGGGKTLASLRYALYHAQKYHKKKIIYVIPLLTIIDQNAEDIEEYLPDEVVLEHHSDVAREDMNDEELWQFDLLRNRWSAPVIITTLVQVLDILFSARTSAVARMRALCDSVMIFDEVQSVPMKTLALYNSALDFLSYFCGTTVILCSATQPEFDAIKDYPLLFSRKPMVSLTAQQRKIFKRQTYHDLSERELSMEELAELAVKINQVQKTLMVVCNTKSEAKKLFEMLNAFGNVKVMHLSAGMCKAHRKTVIDRIKKELSDIQHSRTEERFILVTTQLVEAGVNFSFRAVIRLLAGNDNLVQSAGRCNRSNEYGCGDVYLVRLQGESASLRQLPDIKNAQEAMVETAHHFHSCSDVFNPEDDAFIASYYRNLYKIAENQNETLYPFQYLNKKRYYLVQLLSNDLNKYQDGHYFMSQPFKTAGQYFKVFNENTYDVLVPYEEGSELIERIRKFDQTGSPVPKSILRKAGDFTIQIYEWQKKKLEEKNMLESYPKGHFYYLMPEAYNDSGLNIEAEWETKDFIK